MTNLIESIYTGKININSMNVCDLLSASNYLQIDDVMQFCFDFLTEALCPNNCLVISGIAEHFQNKSLKDKTVDVIAGNFVAVSTTIEFKNFTVHKLRNCISNQDRSIVDEASVFTAILGWIKHDEENRATAFPELLKLVDLHKLPPKLLKDVGLKEKLVTQNLDSCKLFLKAQSKIVEDLLQTDNKTRILSLGGTNTLSKVIEVYKCDGESQLTFPDLPDDRDCGCAAVMRGNLYYIGGRKHVTEHEAIRMTSVWRLDLAEHEFKWEKVKSMNKERVAMGATVFEGNLIVVGDKDPIECYSSIFNSWQLMTSLQQSRGGNALVACQDCLYAIGGFGNGEYLSSVECLQSGDGKWRNVSPMQTPRRWLAAVCCDGFIYAIGGQAGESSDTRLKSVEKYDPSTDEWTYVNDMNIHRSACSACVLRENIFVVGGVNEKGFVIKDTEGYDQLVNSWSIVGKTDEGLFNHSLVAI